MSDPVVAPLEGVVASLEDGAVSRLAAAIQEIAGQVAVVRALVEEDLPSAAGLLDVIGSRIGPLCNLGPVTEVALALLDELETLVALLAVRRSEAAEELQAHGQRRRAIHAYLPPVAAS